VVVFAFGGDIVNFFGVPQETKRKCIGFFPEGESSVGIFPEGMFAQQCLRSSVIIQPIFCSYILE
jgi:hypothetical protein